MPIALPISLPCHVRGTVKLVARRGHISTYRSLSIADAAWVLANCVTPRSPSGVSPEVFFFHTRCSKGPSFSLPTDSDLAFDFDPTTDLPQPLAKQTPWPSPWPCARCNREPFHTVWRPLDGATAFDTEERICGACWVEPESQPDSEGEPFHFELCPHCGCDPAMLE